jgi:hypothetical protein
MWVSSYMGGLENGTITNSVINEILNLSLNNHILSKYSTFLSFESDTGYCKDCYKDNGGWSTDVKETTELPTEISIDAYPNPFNSQVTITVKMPTKYQFKDFFFKIYNILGQVTKTFNVETSGTGIIKICWGGKSDFGFSVVTCVYIFTANGQGVIKSLKLIYLK